MNIVHVGFPKTATTFLQWEIFPKLEGINYVDYRDCGKIFPPLIYLDDLDYNSTEVAQTLKTYKKGDSNLFSFESLAGAPFIFKGLGRSKIPQRLKNLGFDKAVITIRDQVDILDSLYRQYVIQGGVMRCKDFLNRDNKWSLYVRVFNPDYLKYDSLISKYQEVFGVENVLVLTNESLKSNQDNYLGELQKFIGYNLSKSSNHRKANQSLSNLSIAALRIVNHFIFTSQKPNNLLWGKISTKYVSKIFIAILEPYFFRFFSRKRSFLTSDDKQYFKTFYKESNDKLENILKK